MSSQNGDSSADTSAVTPSSSESANGGSEGDLEVNQIVDLPDAPESTASSDFWDYWGDGKAELASYEGEIKRYGELRDAETVLIYVTEPHDRRTWIKDNSVDEEHKVNVMKLNHALKFQTGIYPYSIMTSIFAPVDKWDRRRFQPAKISFTAQEWCGHVWHAVWPGPEQYLTEIRSYFASEGDQSSVVETSEDTLYQNALLIQLRGLDGPFNDGEDWEGKLVPSLWANRKAHTDIEPVSATIERKEATLDGTQVKRFVLSYEDKTITYDLEREYPHRVLRWTHSNGSHFRLQESERLPYWKLNNPGDETKREKMGLDPDAR